MKKVIRCKKCQERVEDYGVGFTNDFSLKCGYFQENVEPDDGCTFGKEGPSKYSIHRRVNVELGGHENVYGSKY